MSKLNRIFAGVGVLCGEIHRRADVLEILGVKRAEVHKERSPNLARMICIVAPRIVGKIENGIGDFQRILAGHANYADTTCPYW